nr:MAG TPA: minor tail protein [Caudoviricetes sp.]
MSEAGNTIDESIGLITAANSVVQNPESVGTAMKTLSLRIRGAKVELEDAGEDVDGMANSVSELQKKLLALTGGKVDIMLDENTFKNTTEILREMSQVWDDMTDVNRAAALELLGGKRQANVLAAVIKNFDLVEEAIQTSADSAGSAMAENEKYMDSIQGHIDQFTNAVQTMWMNFINADATKFLVDVGTRLVSVVDKVGVLKSTILILLGVVAPLKAFLKATEDMSLAERIGKIVTAIRGFSISNIGDSINNLIKTLGLADTAFAEFIARIIEAVATEYAAAGATGVLKMAVKSLETAVLSAIAKIYVALGPVGLIIAAVTVAVGALIAAYVAWGPTHKNFIKKLEEETENLKNIRSNLDSLNSELETTKSRIEELESKGPLTLTEQEELDKLKEQNAELERQIRLEEAREERAKNKQAEAVKGALDTDQDFKTRPTGTLNLKDTNNFEDELGKVKNAKDKLDKAEAEVQDALDSGMDTNSKKFQKLEKNLESAQEDYADAQSNWDEFMKGKEEEYGVSDLEWFDGDNLTDAQKAVNGLLISMQNYNDRAEIMFGSAGAKESALDRLFGERGSEAGQAFQEAFNAKIESGEINVDVDKFGDYESAIEGVTGEVESLIAENPQLKVQLDSLGISAEDVARYFLNISGAMQQTSEATSVAVSDIASLTSAYDSYASVLQTVNDITFDGQAISDDYYTALQEYLGDVTVGEESFGDAIDTTNGKVVKNTRLLRALIAQKKKEQKATVSAAKAQSQSQYTKVVKQLQQAVKAMYADYKAYGYVTKATYDNISALRSQIQALKNAVKEYSILELKLSDVTNAYDEFEDAKNRDSEVAYGDSMVEMLETISDGLLSGKVGTEAFKAACEALVPPSVIANCKTFEERLDAIDDYFENSKFADYFTIDDDGNFSIGLKNIEAFIADAKEASAFIENADGTFTLDSSIKSVDDLANAMGLTKAATIAMLTELSKYDASWGDIVSDLTMTELDKKLRDTTDSLDKALAKQEEFFRAGKDPLGENAEEYNAIQQEIDGATDSLNNAQQAIVDNTKAWIDANNTVDTAKENVSTLTRELQELKDAGASDEEIQIKTDELEKAKEQLAEALKIKYGLEQPTVMDFQVVLTDVQSKIDQWKEENATLVTEVVPKLEQDKDGVWKIPATLELDEDQQQKIQAYVDLKNDEQQLEVLTNQEVDPITDGITQVKEVLDNILDAIQSPDKNKKQDTKTAGEKISEFFTATLPTKWNEFWEGVGTFLTETAPTTSENIETGISTFFTETVPSAINGLWESASSWISTQASNFWNNLQSKFTQGREDAKSGSGYNPDGASSALGNALAKGNAHSGKKPGLKANEHNAIVGELGRELVVDANKGVYYTVGEHGTEMLDLPKGAIIYNHKQTEELLKNGYTSCGTYTGGLSFAKGNAHWNYGTYTKKTDTGANAAWGDGSDKDWSQMGWDLSDAASDLSDAASDVSDAADDAEQTIDFIEYKLEEIEKAITHMTNRIENFLDDTSQIGDKNSLYDDLVGAEKQKASTYFAAAELYNQKATELLSKVPAEYQEMAKNGAIAIKDFIGESEGEIADAIEEYRTWSTKAEDAENSYLESIAEISAKRLEQLNDIADDFENIVGLVEQHSNLIQAEMDLLDEAGERLSENFYKELMKDSQKQIEDLNNKRASLQSILDQAVASGDVRVGTDDWYEMVNAIYDVDDSILSCKKDIEGFQNSINDLYWDNLDKLISKIDNVDSELSHLYNLVSDEGKVVDEFGNWTKDGVTALGLLAQQLEVANFKVEQYGEAIARLEKDYSAGLYSTDEYNEKLAELKENQWDAIEAQESAKKSIIDLNKTRIESVKTSMQAEIDALSKLIDKKKEELSLQKDANDFAKQVAEQQKNIADIQKRLAVISGDNSASAIAQKKKLEAELKQAQDELNDLYYDHSIEKQQEALDKSLENYQDKKQDEMDALDESLKNENQVIQDSYAVIAANTDSLAQNLSEIADKYGITLSDSVTKPWLKGVDAIGTYQEQLDTSASAFTEQLRALKQELVDLQVEADKTADSIIKATNSKKNSTEGAKYTPPTPSTPQQSPATEPSTPAAPTKGSSVTVKSSATHFSRDGGNGTRMQSWVPGSTFTVYQATDSEVLIGRNGGYTGWVRLSDIEGYSSGAKSIDKDQFAFLDELGEELQLVPDGAGRLSYIKKGTGIIPADLTERLMEWGKLDPSSVLEQSRPVVSAPHVINNNLELNLQVGEVVHIDRADNSSIQNITKAVQDQMDNYMKNINKKLYNRVR